jgi:hypothetical protein
MVARKQQYGDVIAPIKPTFSLCFKLDVLHVYGVQGAPIHEVTWHHSIVITIFSPLFYFLIYLHTPIFYFLIYLHTKGHSHRLVVLGELFTCKEKDHETFDFIFQFNVPMLHSHHLPSHASWITFSLQWRTITPSNVVVFSTSIFRMHSPYDFMYSPPFNVLFNPTIWHTMYACLSY